MYVKIKEHLQQELAGIKEAGLYKNERIITTPPRANIKLADGRDVLNFCANNYLGLSDNPRLIEAATKAMQTHGYGMSSVRFICGTQDIHKELEAAISDYFKTEDTILYAACFDANGGVFEPLLTDEDAIISDALNHASIIDGVRLCKAKRYRYANADMEDLERCLQEAQAQRFRIIVTDGVFSMDGNVAPMDKICDLAEKYDALVMVDECHSAGVVGATGHGVSEQFNCYGRIDIHTGTLGKAFGGAIGGFTTGRKEIIDLLRQRSRPYLFSNSIPPSVVGASLEMFRILKESNDLHTKQQETTFKFKTLDQYSTLFLTVANAQPSYMVQLLDGDKVARQQRVEKGQADFYFLKPGTYHIRLFNDRNGNGVWDTGLYETKLQAEEVYYFPGSIKTRENWDYTQ